METCGFSHREARDSRFSDLIRGGIRLKRVVVAGGAGFIGSHLVDALLKVGNAVTVIDNLHSGSLSNLGSAVEHPLFNFIKGDICEKKSFDQIGIDVSTFFNLASPASPYLYQRWPLETLQAGSTGIWNVIDFSELTGCRVIQASTSEVYGDPLVHPQIESYFGNVNPIGPRSCYDESKRFAEAALIAASQSRGLSVGIARIFNTYGPRLSPADGRVVSNFVRQALLGEPLTVFGDGRQTRSFCYVDDLVQGLLSLEGSNENGPFNLGNPIETTVVELAALIKSLTGSESLIELLPLPVDDPRVRCPNISLARETLGWSPTVGLKEGLIKTISWFRLNS